MKAGGGARPPPRPSAKTARKNKDVLEPILAAIGTMRLEELTSADVDTALAHMAAYYSTAAVAIGHLNLKRAIRRAPARRYVAINPAEFAETPRVSPAGPACPSPSTRPARCCARVRVRQSRRHRAHLVAARAAAHLRRPDV